MSSAVRKLSRAFCASGIWMGALVAQALAQQATPPASGPTVVTFSRPLWTEAAITVVMIGLVLFAVCRSSRRT